MLDRRVEMLLEESFENVDGHGFQVSSRNALTVQDSKLISSIADSRERNLGEGEPVCLEVSRMMENGAQAEACATDAAIIVGCVH